LGVDRAPRGLYVRRVGGDVFDIENDKYNVPAGLGIIGVNTQS